MNAHTTLFDTVGALRELRPDQNRAVTAIRASLRAGKRRPLLQAPTGFGKTLTAAHIIQEARGRGKRIIFTVPALTLIDQTVAAFQAEGIWGIGVMQGTHHLTDVDQPVQVCSVQTLARRQKPRADLVLVDEAHQMHKSMLAWMAEPAWAGVPFIGLSATPWSKGLGRHFDDLIVAATTSDLIRDGYLSKFVAYAPSTPDLSGVRTVAGEFKQDDLGLAMDRMHITGDIVDTWVRRGEDRPTIAYCVNRKHAQHICERFLEVGVRAEYMDGETPREDREDSFRRFRAGDTTVLCNVGVLTTGVDLDVRCIIDAKPTRSPILFVQTIGRGLRTAPGKDRLIILDHAGNHLRLGMVTDQGQDHLDAGTMAPRASEKAKERPPAKPRLCPECKAVVPRVERLCPSCGHQIITVTEVEAKDGELIELGSKPIHLEGLTKWDKANFYRELLALKKPHYKNGWVSVMYKQRFGIWPDPIFSSLTAAEPTLATRNWLKSRQIAWAKSQGFARG